MRFLTCLISGKSLKSWVTFMSLEISIRDLVEAPPCGVFAFLCAGVCLSAPLDSGFYVPQLTVIMITQQTERLSTANTPEVVTRSRPNFCLRTTYGVLLVGA